MKSHYRFYTAKRKSQSGEEKKKKIYKTAKKDTQKKVKKYVFAVT